MTEVEEVIDNNMTPIKADALNDGEYDINALSSSSMFKIEGAKLVVADGKLTVTMVMGGKGYLYIYPGTPEEAAAANESDYISFEENEDGKLIIKHRRRRRRRKKNGMTEAFALLQVIFL